LKVWIIYPRYVSLRTDNAFEWLRGEAEAQGITLEVVFYEDLTLVYGENYALLHNGKAVGEYPTAVIARGYEYAVSRHFELHGIPVVNSTRSMYLCKDKTLSAQLLTSHGIPTPLTVAYAGGNADYASLADLFGSKRFIVKQNDGAKGENVFLINSSAEMEAAVRSCGSNCLFQKFVEESSGRDMRIWVVGGRAIAGVVRRSTGSFLSNYSQGGRVEPLTLTPEASSLAESAAEALGLEFAGVDILFAAEGYTVCEVNGNAGFRTLSQVGRNNIPEELFRYIKTI
jgi:RimK family alpha-L-glutamate ligase